LFEVIQLLVEEIKRDCHPQLDALDKEQCPLPDVTVQEIYLLLAIILQLGHDQKNTLKDY